MVLLARDNICYALSRLLFVFCSASSVCMKVEYTHCDAEDLAKGCSACGYCIERVVISLTSDDPVLILIFVVLR